MYNRRRNHTYYVAKDLDFATLAAIIAELERDLPAEDTVDIIFLFTGEVYANKNYLGLWEIHR